MTIYEQMMADPQTNRWVLVTFGFGKHQPARIEKAFKAYYPPKYHEFRRKANALKVVPMTTEGMSKDRRNRILDKEAAVISLINKGEWE